MLEPTSVFFWMRDQKQAVYLTNRFGVGARGLATFTDDSMGIEDFKHEWGGYKKYNKNEH